MIINFPEELARYEIQPKSVLHIGAHEGQEDEVYQSIDAVPVYVEANPDVYKRLRSRLPDRECHNLAISDSVGTAEFHITSMDQSSSLLQLGHHSRIYPDIVATKTIQVPCTTANDLFKGREQSFDMLNLDIQGAELMALRGATQLLPHVQCILTEVNLAELYKGCAMIGELDAFLRGFDFRRVKTACPYHKTWGDALYVKADAIAALPMGRRVANFFHNISGPKRAA